MELNEFIDHEMTEKGPRHQRWPIKFKISFYKMVVHMYEPIPGITASKLPRRKIFRPFSFNPSITLSYVDRHHLVERFPNLLSDDKIVELGHPNFQQNFCNRNGLVRQQVWIWNCRIDIDELVCVKLLKVKHISLTSDVNFEFHMLMDNITVSN